jgi:hypothetical protein
VFSEQLQPQRNAAKVAKNRRGIDPDSAESVQRFVSSSEIQPLWFLGESLRSVQHGVETRHL